MEISRCFCTPSLFRRQRRSPEQVVVALLSRLHFSLPGTPDERGQLKEIYWKISALQVPVVRPPSGDGVAPQVPLEVRRVRDDDFEIGAST